MEPELRKTSLRFYEIDFLRFIAAMSVVIYHYTYVGYNLSHLSPIRYEYFEQITKYFYLGVQLFFVISGYTILMSSYNKSLKQFFISRVIRLYPIFWIACTLTFIVIILFGPNRDSVFWSERMHVTVLQYVVNMTMLQKFMGYSDIDGVYWTLSIEMSFYFLISLLISYGIFKYLDFFVVFCLLYSFATWFSTAVNTPFHNLFFPEYICFFITGMLFYLLQNKMMSLWKIYSLLLVAYVFCIHNSCAEVQKHSQVFHQVYSTIVVSSVVTVIFIVFWAIAKGVITVKHSPGLKWLGGLTYPLYLFHGNIGYIIFQNFGYLLNKYFLLLIVISIMLLISFVIHFLIESKIQSYFNDKLKRFFVSIER